ncbi:MAG TPA: carbohydrate binding domain-containing protein [Armatimonadota bacterium]|nr:carbohydrate binding domain-containing protein [Armatimonadota bacterium]
MQIVSRIIGACLLVALLKLPLYASTTGNLVANGDFETLDAGGQPVGWTWTPQNTDATCVVDPAIAHGGKSSIRIKRGTAFTQNLYATLEGKPISLVPGQQYSMSVWVRYAANRQATLSSMSIMSGDNGRIRVPLQLGKQNEWFRVVVTFTAGEQEKTFTPRFIIDYPVYMIWLDDVQITPGMEDLQTPNPLSWRWALSGPAQASFQLDSQMKHSGKYAVCLKNETPLIANVFGRLISSRITLKAGIPYTLLAWVKSDDPAKAQFACGSKWQFRCNIPATGDEWKMVTMTFVPEEADTNFELYLITAGISSGVWYDDMMLVAGSVPDPSLPNLLPNGTFDEIYGLGN